MINYIGSLLNMEEELKKLKSLIEQAIDIRLSAADFFVSSEYQGSIRPLKGLFNHIDLFGIDVLTEYREYLLKFNGLLEKKSNLELYMSGMSKTVDMAFSTYIKFFSNYKKVILDRLSILDKEEILRLNEALHCFIEDCNYSTVAMSVTAVEYRLLSLMSSIDPSLPRREFTLGQLIREYNDNKQRYNEIIPKKYEPLLSLCNAYRIFSVHAKEERINKSIATAIIHLSFQFLLDDKLRMPDGV